MKNGIVLAASIATVSALMGASTARSEYSLLPVTSQWFRVEADPKAGAGSPLNSSNLGVFFRRYGIVMNLNKDGQHTFQDLRNLINFFCPFDSSAPSYLIFFIPREISLKELYGGAVSSDNLRLRVTMGESDSFAILQMEKNVLYMDYTKQNTAMINHILSGKPSIIWLNNNYGVGFKTFTGQVPFNGRKHSFDEFIELQLQQTFQHHQITVHDYKQIMEHCIK